MANPKPLPTRRALDTLESVQSEAEDLIHDIEAAKLLGALPPSASEVREFLDAVIDLPSKADGCDDCADASTSIGNFADPALEGNLTEATNAMVTVLGHSDLTGAQCQDAVEAFKRSVLRELAIKWVAERAYDFGQKDLAEQIAKLETL